VRGIDVLGSQKSIELVSTINSMIAMMKIATPLVFMSALFVALLGVLFIPW
jgi:predicted neutral ceramidase superfamily lipid hydrolase